MLEMKIKELRSDIDLLTQKGEEKSYKTVVRKMN